MNREKTIFSSYFAKESISNMRRFHEHNRLEMFRNMHHLHSNSVELYKKSVVFVVEIDHWVKLSKLKTRIVTDFGSNWDHFAICSCSVLCWWQCFIDIKPHRYTNLCPIFRFSFEAIANDINKFSQTTLTTLIFNGEIDRWDLFDLLVRFHSLWTYIYPFRCRFLQT